MTGVQAAVVTGGTHNPGEAIIRRVHVVGYRDAVADRYVLVRRCGQRGIK